MNSKLKSFLVFLVGALLMVAMFFFCVHILQNEGKSFEKKRVPLEQERQAAMEEARKLDPEEHKIVLTDRVLKADYKIFYESGKSAGDAFLKIVVVFITVVIVMSIGSAVLSVLRARRKGEAVNIIRLVYCVFPIIFSFIFFFLIRSMSSKSNGPKPEKVGYKVYTVNILRKRSEVETSTDSDGHTTETTKYYIYFEGTGGQEVKQIVRMSLYDKVTDPGLYYLAMAEDGSDKIYFAIYTLDKYVKADQV